MIHITMTAASSGNTMYVETLDSESEAARWFEEAITEQGEGEFEFTVDMFPSAELDEVLEDEP